jgi:hypothetical protein
MPAERSGSKPSPIEKLSLTKPVVSQRSRQPDQLGSRSCCGRGRNRRYPRNRCHPRSRDSNRSSEVERPAPATRAPVHRPPNRAQQRPPRVLRARLRTAISSRRQATLGLAERRARFDLRELEPGIVIDLFHALQRSESAHLLTGAQRIERQSCDRQVEADLLGKLPDRRRGWRNESGDGQQVPYSKGEEHSSAFRKVPTEVRVSSPSGGRISKHLRAAIRYRRGRPAPP